MRRNIELKLSKGNIEIYDRTQSFFYNSHKIKNGTVDREANAIQKLKSFFEGNRLPYKIHPGSFCP
jgi:hypothetical protein